MGPNVYGGRSQRVSGIAGKCVKLHKSIMRFRGDDFVGVIIRTASMPIDPQLSVQRRELCFVRRGPENESREAIAESDIMKRFKQEVREALWLR